MSAITIHDDLSLFAQATRIAHAPLFTQSRPNLIKLSQQIENGVIHGSYGARVFVGFQKLSNLLPHLGRYQQMATVAESIWVFGLPDIELPDVPALNIITLPANHELSHEWFVVVESADYFSALVARDLSGFDVPLAQRQYQGIWTFNAGIVSQFQTYLSQLVNAPPFVLPVDARNYDLQTTNFSLIANQLIETLQQRNDDLERTQTLHRQLFNMIVHDLRNPLTGLMGFIDLIERGIYDQRSPDVLLDFVQETRRSHAELSILIDNILDINKIEGGQFPIEATDFPLRPVLEDLRHQYMALAKLRRLSLDVEIDGPNLTAYADETVLRRVVSNLLSNAIRHTRQGGVQIRAISENSHIVVAVSDTGEGIAAHDVGYVFDPYYQGNNSRIRGAAGLGLTFCKRAVEAQGGEIWVESTLGEGSVFYVTIPRG